MNNLVKYKWQKANGSKPVYLQIADFISESVENGDLYPECKLPGHRKLAEMFNVSLNTILSALQILDKRGVINLNPRKKAEIAGIEENGPNWNSYLSSALYNSRNTSYYTFVNNHYKALNLSTGLNKDYFFRDMFNEIIPTIHLPEKMDANSLGLRDLRKEIAIYMKRFDIDIQYKQVMLTTSVTHGLNVLFIALLGHGANLLLPHPCNLAISNLVSTTGANIVKINMDDEGIDPQKLTKYAQNLSNCILCVPADHNLPTGITMTTRRREEILHICAKYKIPIIEHTFLPLGVYKDLPPTMKSLDKNNTVIHVSQIGSAGFTNPWLGWILADEYLIKQLNNVRYNFDAYQNYIIQTAVLELMRTNKYGVFMDNVGNKILYRRNEIKKMLHKYFSDIATWNKDNIDSSVWLKFEKGINTSHLYDVAETITFHPGRFYSEHDTSHIFIYPVAQSMENLDYGLNELRKLINTEYFS